MRPTLDALTSITGLEVVHDSLAERGWEMPSLARVEQEGWSGDRLGRLIVSSRSLRRVSGQLFWSWVEAFEGMPVAGPGEAGPLSQLEAIGTINITAQELDQLHATLTSRGCRNSIKQLDLSMSGLVGSDIALLSALDRFVAACCASPDIPVTFAASLVTFNPMILCHSDFPAHPSPALTSVMKQVAEQTDDVRFDLTPNPSLTPAPKQSAIDLAGQLSFANAKTVTFNSTHVDRNSPVPRPSIFGHMQRISNCEVLRLLGRVDEESSRLLASKMPTQLHRMDIKSMPVSDAVGAMRGLGRDRRVEWLEFGFAVMDEGSIDQLVGAAADLPVIHSLCFNLTVREDRADKDEYVRHTLSSLLQQLRGLQRLVMYLVTFTEMTAVADGTTLHGFTIRTGALGFSLEAHRRS
ncbi:unnamed protein product [Vitrella brassicaformis CCMP3155]|uniref:Uncharacterized protein n=1 Tax=Vitrella brassicaformis (strain CCMP3155) TaxID=1169540 RepID=A0A0G4ESW3_VITBC|nr:unnamed protein product [Vitrella brassicaformis CCMP3155]|eukprot:CEM00806.1 unnamed protein product [Vitrella brassicaformis CCMP3155]